MSRPYRITPHITGTNASIVEGNVPDGLALSANGVLSGTSSAEGSYNVVVGKTTYTASITARARRP